jgi:hypothetical protein
MACYFGAAAPIFFSVPLFIHLLISISSYSAALFRTFYWFSAINLFIKKSLSQEEIIG